MKNVFLGLLKSAHSLQGYGTETDEDFDVNFQGQATSLSTQNSENQNTLMFYTPGKVSLEAARMFE